MGSGISRVRDRFSSRMPNGMPKWPESPAYRPQKVNAYGTPRHFSPDITFLTPTGGTSVGKFNSMTYVADVDAFYMYPSDSSLTIRRVDGKTNAQTAVGTGIGSAQTRGAQYGKSGRIVAAPFNATTIHEVNPFTNTRTTFGSVAAGAGKYDGCVYTKHDRTYCCPYNASTILVIRNTERTVYTFGSVGAATTKWRQPKYAPNGKIYCIPYSAQTVLVIDPRNDTHYTIPLPTNASQNGSLVFNWGDGTMFPDGKIYCAGYSANATLIIDTWNDTITSFLHEPDVLHGGATKYSKNLGATVFGSFHAQSLGTNFKAYAASGFAANYSDVLAMPMEIDPEQRTGLRFKGSVTAFSSTINGTAPHISPGRIGQDGSIIFPPYGAQSIMKISGFPPATPDMYTMPANLEELPGSLYNLFMNT